MFSFWIGFVVTKDVEEDYNDNNDASAGKIIFADWSFKWVTRLEQNWRCLKLAPCPELDQDEDHLNCGLWQFGCWCRRRPRTGDRQPHSLSCPASEPWQSRKIKPLHLCSKIQTKFSTSYLTSDTTCGSACRPDTASFEFPEDLKARFVMSAFNVTRRLICFARTRLNIFSVTNWVKNPKLHFVWWGVCGHRRKWQRERGKEMWNKE